MVDSTQTSTEETSGPGVLKKINPKDVMQTSLKKIMLEVQKAGGTTKDLFTVIGRANNIRTGESNFGPWESLRGEFEAVNLDTGERFISGECFVPGAAGDLLVNQVRAFVIEPNEVTPEVYKKSGKTYRVTGDTVEMALIVGIKENLREGGQPYEFTVRPIVSVQRADSLAALRERAQKFVKALPAPKPAESTLPDKTPEPKGDAVVIGKSDVGEVPSDLHQEEKKKAGGKK